MTSYVWNGQTGDWTTAGDWTPTGVPGSADAAGITAAGTYTVLVNGSESVAAGSVTLNSAGATLEVDGTLTAGTLALQAGTLDLTGTLANATVAASGGSLVPVFGTFSNVTYQGTLNLGTDAALQVENGFRLSGAGGNGAATVNINGADASGLILLDSETLANATINVGSATGFDYISADADLTLASNTTLNAAGVQGFQVFVGGTLTNQGVITAGIAGGSAAISAASFVNNSAVTVSNGDSLDIGAPVTGSGTLSLAGGTLELDGTVASTQRIAFAGAPNLLVLTDAADDHATASGFTSGDRIDLTGLSPLSGKVSFANGVATVTGGTQPISLAFAGNYSGQGFGLVSDGNGGSDLITGKTYSGSGKAKINTGSSNAIVSLTGNGNSVTASGGDVVVTATGSLDALNLGQGYVAVALSGAGDLVTAGNGADLVSGTATASAVSLGNGNDIVSLAGSADAVSLGNGNDSVQGSASYSLFALGNGSDTVNLTGAYDVVSVGTGSDTISLTGGHDVAVLTGGPAAVTLGGTGDAVFLGASQATITDNSSGLNVYAGTNAVNSVITNVAADPQFVLDLTGGVGGYTTAAAAYAALQSDGHGGSILALGSTGSVDFAGVAASQLSANNFRIVSSHG